MQFTHIVNPYSASANGLDPIQKITLDSLIVASKATMHKVTLLSTQFKSDRSIVPDGFVMTADLTRSIREVAGLSGAKELPFLADVLSKSVEVPETEFVIYSNMDIIPGPSFYNAIGALIREQKCDALIVNRRRISATLINKPELLFSETGLPHPGYDCFVFKKELLPLMSLGNCCIGAPGVGFLLAHNLFLLSNKCVVVSNKLLTFHLGYDIVSEWAGNVVAQHQRMEVKKFLKEKKGLLRIEKFPGYNLPFFRRHFKWLLNPLFDYRMMFFLDLKAMFDGRVIKRNEKKDSWWQEWKSSRINFD